MAESGAAGKGATIVPTTQTKTDPTPEVPASANPGPAVRDAARRYLARDKKDLKTFRSVFAPVLESFNSLDKLDTMYQQSAAWTDEHDCKLEGSHA